MACGNTKISMLISIVGVLVAALGFFLALAGLAVALSQVRYARRISKLEGDIIALEVFLTAELAGKRDEEVIRKILELMFAKVEQLGSRDVLEMKDILEP